MERRISRRINLPSSKVGRKSVSSENAKECNNSILSPVNFNSETLSSSSPLKPDVAKKTRTRRKKIRSTQDFNQLNNSMTSQESDTSKKSEIKKTRKPKGVYVLPKITNLLEDPFACKENKSPVCNVMKKERKKKAYSRKLDKVSHFIESDIGTITQKNAGIRKMTTVTKKGLIENSEENESLNFEISDSGDPEVEIKLKKKGEKNGCRDDTITNESYAKRTRKMLLNDCGSSEERGGINSPMNFKNSVKELPESKFTRKSRSVSNKSVQQKVDIGNVRGSKSLVDIFDVSLVKTKGKDKRSTSESTILDKKFATFVGEQLNEQGRYVRSNVNIEVGKKRSSTGRGYSQISNTPIPVLDTNELNRIRRSKHYSEDYSVWEHTGIKQTGMGKSSENDSHVMSVDEAEDSDDVFDGEKECSTGKQRNQVISADKLKLNTGTKNQIRKSVRFAEASPKEDNIRRCTFDVNTCSINIKLFNDKSVEEAIEIATPDMFNREDTSDSITNSIKEILNEKTPCEESLPSDPDDEDKLNGTFEVSSSKSLSVSKNVIEECNAVVPLSPIYGKYSLKRAKRLNSNYNFLGKTLSNSTMITSENICDIPSVDSNTKKTAIFCESKDCSKNSPLIAMHSNSLIDLSTPYSKELPKNSDVILIESSYEESGKKSLSRKLCTGSRFSQGITEDERNLNMTFDSVNPDVSKTLLQQYVRNTRTLPEPELDIVSTLGKDIICEVLENSPVNTRLETSVKLATPVKKLHKSVANKFVETASSQKTIQPYSPRNLHKPSILFSNPDSESTTSNKNIVGMLGITSNNVSKLLDDNDGNVQTSGMPKLNRTATFTKDNQDNVKKNIQSNIIFNSPTVNESPVNKTIDTSKVTKRRQWNTFRPSRSFLDSPVDIGNISAPWKERTFNNTTEILQGNGSEHLSGLDISMKMGKNCGTFSLGTSTPLPERKNISLKDTLLKNMLDINKNQNITKPSNSRPVVKSTRTKMPNFALIHQRTYDKLESLKEMSERKAQRAKLLLSGCKPDSSTNINTSSKSRKLLQFNPAKSTKIPSSISAKSDKTEKKIILHSSNVSITKIKNISPSKSNLKVLPKKNTFTSIEKKKELLRLKPSQIPTKVSNNIVAEKKGVTRYGFKMGTTDLKKTKEEQLKAFASKTQAKKNTVEERRNVIRGVRSNRRFELLMGLRNK